MEWMTLYVSVCLSVCVCLCLCQSLPYVILFDRPVIYFSIVDSI